jgi:hypothetical protein
MCCFSGRYTGTTLPAGAAVHEQVPVTCMTFLEEMERA